MSKKNYDVVVIGAGPAGYVCAIRCAQLGLTTAIIEKEKLGGVCLNWGCIPTKALLTSADVYRKIRNADKYGLKIKSQNIDFDSTKIIERSIKIAEKLSMGVSYLMQKNKVEVIKASASFIDENTLKLTTDDTDEQISAHHIVIASGSRPKDLPFAKADGKNIWNYRHVLRAYDFPKSLLIIGSGAIGVEFASFFNEFETEVTIIEMLPQILPSEDAEIADIARKSLEKQGIKIITNAQVENIENKRKSIKADIIIAKQSSQIEAEKVLLAIGIKANIEQLNAQKIGIACLNGHIVTDKDNRTNIANIFAIGDVTAPPWLAHKASHEAIIAAQTIAGWQNHQTVNAEDIARCVYCYPQLASIGLTQQQAENKNIPIKIGKFPFNALGKALASGENNGMVKVIIEKNTAEIIGVHMIGEEVTEIINTIAVAKHSEATGVEITQAVFAHPTISEAIHEAFLDAFAKAVNI